MLLGLRMPCSLHVKDQLVVSHDQKQIVRSGRSEGHIPRPLTLSSRQSKYPLIDASHCHLLLFCNIYNIFL
jgi:hypothetical protein